MSAFNSEIDVNEYFNCESCSNQTKWEEKINYQDESGPWFCPKCAYESDLRAPYSMDQCITLTIYAEKHKITFEEAIYYQTHCHCCGKEDKDGIFDEENHQYCNRRCFEYCEDYRYLCHKEADCKVCELWQYHQDKEKEEETLYIYDFEGTGEQLRRLRANNPILANETADEYVSRIWYLAYKEDEEKEKEEEKKRVKVEND
jgi:hypothetical protein